MRISGGWSEVAATITDFLSPSSPKFFFINSLTSLPLSPMSAITLTSAFAYLAIIPINVLFPNPGPAKIPILCPLANVRRPLIALMPTSKGS